MDASITALPSAASSGSEILCQGSTPNYKSSAAPVVWTPFFSLSRTLLTYSVVWPAILTAETNPLIIYAEKNLNIFLEISFYIICKFTYNFCTVSVGFFTWTFLYSVSHLFSSHPIKTTACMIFTFFFNCRIWWTALSWANVTTLHQNQRLATLVFRGKVLIIWY